MKNIIFIFLLLFIACAPLELPRLLGIGTRPFKTQGKIYRKIVNKDFFSCYEEVFKVLGKLKAHFYRGSRQQGFVIFTNFNVVFPQASESTEVAVFFQELGPKRTEIEVSSLNYSLSEFVAKELFGTLKK